MKIACVGGGPAGLYFAISMKLRDPSHDITIFERNPPGVTFGWGVVFSDLTVENITRNDPASAAIITQESAHWDDIDVHVHGASMSSRGHVFIAIGRTRHVPRDLRDVCVRTCMRSVGTAPWRAPPSGFSTANAPPPIRSGAITTS